MADLMGSYIPDLVLKIDNGELTQLLNHLPNVPAHQTFWEKFFDTPVAVVAACSAVVTVFVSVGTLGVTIFNSFLTSKFTKANHKLSTQQTDTALENKEISKRKYNLDVINKRWTLFSEYLSDYQVVSESVIRSFITIFPGKMSDNSKEVFMNFFYEDASKRIKAFNNITSFFIMVQSFTSEETTEEIKKLEHSMSCLIDKLSSHRADTRPSITTITKLKSYQNASDEYFERVDERNNSFIESFVKNELDGLKKME